MKNKKNSQREKNYKNKQNKANKSEQNIKAYQKPSTSEVLMHSQKSYFSYLWKLIKESNRYKLYEKAWRYFRPFRIAFRIFRWVFILLTWIQASALLIVAAALALLAAPVVALFVLVFFLFVRIDATLKLRCDGDILRGKSVVVLFRNQEFSKYFSDNVSLLSRNYVVLVVCDMFAWRYKNASAEEKRFFLNRLELGDGAFLVRAHYFFFLKSRALACAQRVFFVY